jgi:hypothetical protein
MFTLGPFKKKSRAAKTTTCKDRNHEDFRKNILLPFNSIHISTCPQNEPPVYEIACVGMF